jgi:aryl-alcohol dehydrogenase-like predicted oxidoreductase
LNKRKLGQSNILVSELGLGCMSLGSNFENAENIISEALASGMNYFDTADLYDYGLNEQFIGKALSGCKREDVIIATKVGNRFHPGKEGWEWDPSPTYIKEAVKKSLHRLQTDYIDLYQLHGGTIEDPIDEIIDTFEQLKQEGLIREYGISSIRPNVIKEYVERSNIVSVMMQYNILDRRPEEELLDYLANNHVSVIARGPLAKGILTDQWTHVLNQKFSNKDFLSYTHEELLSITEKLVKLANPNTLQSLALQYPLSHPAVATTIPGASSVRQLQNNVTALRTSEKLSNEQLLAIQKISKALMYENHRC